MKKWSRKIGMAFILVFAVIGIVFTAVFVGMQLGLTNVRGSSKDRNASFGKVPTITTENECLKNNAGKAPLTCAWNETTEWEVVKGGLTKDELVIKKVAEQTGVNPRMIASVVTPEQLRYFTANRESFKKYFEPLKILSSLTKFSLGISGIKQDTARDIENFANDPSSDFYPGDGMADLISYDEGVNKDQVLYDRLTNSHDHYYSYLYTALFIKEIEAQWAKAGFDIKDNPEVVVTLFNIGFKASHPNADPKIAGSTITIGGSNYSFGKLGTLFYRSDELTDIFPR